MLEVSVTEASPYFLELFGETSPQVDPDYAQVLAGRGKATGGPIYEYFWTVGRNEPPPQQRDERDPHWGRFSAHTFARVYVLFPRNDSWRAHELAASVKYLAPVPVQKSFTEEMDKDIAALQPLLGVAGTVAGAAGAAGVGPVASATGHVLDAVAKMKVGSVPQARGFEWSVEKFSTRIDEEPVDGVGWNLPQSMLATLGSRIGGSIAVSLLPLSKQEEEEETPSAALNPGTVRACATLPLATESVRLPSNGSYVCLRVHPR